MKRLPKRKRVTGVSAVIALAFTMLLLMAGNASASNMPGTHTISGYTGYKSIVGITVAKHWSTTTYTNEFRSTGYCYLTTPKSTTNDWWTLPPTSVTNHSKGWSWYSSSKNGTGRSYIKVTFKWGVPTPWGPVGGGFTDTHQGHVFASSAQNPYMTYLP